MRVNYDRNTLYFTLSCLGRGMDILSVSPPCGIQVRTCFARGKIIIDYLLNFAVKFLIEL